MHNFSEFMHFRLNIVILDVVMQIYVCYYSQMHKIFYESFQEASVVSLC